MSKLLWVLQVLLAALFLFAGVMKFVMPAEEMAKQLPVSVPFIRFIGVCEILGAVGLILPSALRIRPGLTPLAAAGLVIIMAGATVVTAQMGPLAPALFPLVVGLLAAFVAYGRTRLIPLRAKGDEAGAGRADPARV
jgi:uncharacterized membrane protein